MEKICIVKRRNNISNGLGQSRNFMPVNSRNVYGETDYEFNNLANDGILFDPADTKERTPEPLLCLQSDGDKTRLKEALDNKAGMPLKELMEDEKTLNNGSSG